MCESQAEPTGTVSPVSSDAFDALLHQVALNSRLTSAQHHLQNGSEQRETTPIGEAAGAVWHSVSENGRSTFSFLIETIHMPESLLFMAVGWLAREDKIEIKAHWGDYEIRLK